MNQVPRALLIVVTFTVKRVTVNLIIGMATTMNSSSP